MQREQALLQHKSHKPAGRWLRMSGMTLELSDILACPRCDKTPLEQTDDVFHCAACKVDFPSVDGIPWMFAEPEASLGDATNPEYDAESD